MAPPVAIDEPEFPHPNFTLLAKGNQPVAKDDMGRIYDAKTPKGNRGRVREITLGRVPEDVAEIRQRAIDQLQEFIEEVHDYEHPNLIHYYGVNEAVGSVLLYSELGKSPLDCSAPMPEDKVKTILKGVLQAVAYLHEQGTFHGELTPENIFFGNVDPTPKLGEWGVGKMLRDIANPNSGFNSIQAQPYFLAPEVLAGGEYDQQTADIWALGCCVGSMLTGKGPWSSIKNQGQVILAVMKGKEPPFELADSSEDARSFVSECFERNVEKRPTIEALLEHPFVK